MLVFNIHKELIQINESIKCGWVSKYLDQKWSTVALCITRFIFMNIENLKWRKEINKIV